MQWSTGTWENKILISKRVHTMQSKAANGLLGGGGSGTADVNITRAGAEGPPSSVPGRGGLGGLNTTAAIHSGQTDMMLRNRARQNTAQSFQESRQLRGAGMCSYRADQAERQQKPDVGSGKVPEKGMAPWKKVFIGLVVVTGFIWLVKPR